MNAATRHKPKPRNGSSPQRNASALLPLLVASASAATLVATPADALELGQIQVESTLGQPLRASIAYALNPREELYDFCISLTKGAADGVLPNLTKANVSIANERILIDGLVPVKEPLLAMRLTVDCPYTVHLSRQYTLMLDPAAVPTPDANAKVAPARTVAPVMTRVQPAASVAADRPAVNDSPLASGAKYRVQIGDTLSEIASRIENRPVALWPAVQLIFDANPEAFIDGDMNRLAAGALLTIPFLQEGAMVTKSMSTPSSRVEQAAATNVSAYDGFRVAAQDIEPELPGEPAAEAPSALPPAAAAPEADSYGEEAREIADDTTVLSAGTEQAAATIAGDTDKFAVAQPGDLFVGTDIAAEAEVEVQRPAAVVAQPVEESAGMASWLIWALGAGLAVIAGMLVFGRSRRDRVGGAAALQPVPARRATDLDDTASNQALGDMDFQFDEPLPGNVDMVLDADLGAGTGLRAGDAMDVAQDFGFSAAADSGSDLDMVLSEAAGDDSEAIQTDIIPPQRQDPTSILEQEVLPDENDDSEYDLSMIIDATRQPITETQVTAKELNVLRIDVDRPTDITDGMRQEVDLEALSQDYEDELTATQALNQEIEKAAMQLASRMDDERTAEMPAQTEGEPGGDLTAEMPVAAAENDDVIGDLDDTGVNEELTARLWIDDDTAAIEDLTVDIDADDVTVEMGVEPDTLDTRKRTG